MIHVIKEAVFGLSYLRQTLRALFLAGAVIGTGAAPSLATADSESSTATRHECSAPALAPDGFERAHPEQVEMDGAALQRAIDFASSRMRTNIQVFRYNCLVGEGPFNDISGNIPGNLMSGTKSVVSMIAGVAVTHGLLDVEAPIGNYLPEGEGDAAHRAITVRSLLTQSSGLDQAILSEAFPSLLDVTVDAPKTALDAPILHPQGERFQYSQLGPDLLGYVLQNAVGEDLQSFAQRELFDPIGIAPNDYYWARDRTGHTYGFALLFLPPNDFARLGMLMANNGSWNGREVISADYIAALREPSASNPCYGFLFWLNKTPCTGPSVPSTKTTDVAPMAGLPDDGYAMVGFLQQNNFIIPSLGLQVTWTGILGDVSPDPGTVLSASLASELYSNFFNALSAALPQEGLMVPPYVPQMNLDLDPDGLFDIDISSHALGLGPNSDEAARSPLSAAPPGCVLLVCAPISPQTPHRIGQ